MSDFSLAKYISLELSRYHEMPKFARFLTILLKINLKNGLQNYQFSNLLTIFLKFLFKYILTFDLVESFIFYNSENCELYSDHLEKIFLVSGRLNMSHLKMLHSLKVESHKLIKLF